MHGKGIFRGWAAGVGLLLLLSGKTQAQWLTQTVPLQPGWNAVHLEVQPEPRALDTVFSNAAVLSVWKWDRRFSHIEFTTDPYTLEPEDPHWLVWLPATDPKRFLARLFELQGQQAYLVRVATNAAAFNVAVQGRVILPLLDWYPHGLTLAGFPVHPNHPPTFADFFKFTPEVDTTRGFNNQLFAITNTGRGVTIVQPARERMAPGRAYWVGCAKDPKQMGPLHVEPEGAGALNFGTTAVQQDLTIQNLYAASSLVVRVVQTASETPAEGYPELAGPVPLSYQIRNASNAWEWHEFPAGGLEQTLGPGEEWTLKLGVRRQDFAAYTPVDTNGCAYQSILEVTDAGESLRVRVPVVAEKHAVLLGDELGAHHENEGLWVGSATLDQVNAPAYSDTNLLATVAPLTLRLIVHVDGYGQCRLLQQVLLAWDSAQTNAPHTNGTYALFLEDADVPADSEEVIRVSSVAFPLMESLWLTGDFTNELWGTFQVGYDDPVNPFLHRYHPMHDNQDWDFEPYSNAVETLEISREITLAFAEPATNWVDNPYWGVDRAWGTYRETLTGLRAQEILVEGTFLLQRISTINEIE
jgi:hypothetical protein